MLNFAWHTPLGLAQKLIHVFVHIVALVQVEKVAGEHLMGIADTSEQDELTE